MAFAQPHEGEHCTFQLPKAEHIVFVEVLLVIIGIVWGDENRKQSRWEGFIYGLAQRRRVSRVRLIPSRSSGIGDNALIDTWYSYNACGILRNMIEGRSRHYSTSYLAVKI